jgi:hypothetical protein
VDRLYNCLMIKKFYTSPCNSLIRKCKNYDHLQACKEVVVARLRIRNEYHKANNTRGTPEMWAPIAGEAAWLASTTQAALLSYTTCSNPRWSVKDGQASLQIIDVGPILSISLLSVLTPHSSAYACQMISFTLCVRVEKVCRGIGPSYACGY